MRTTGFESSRPKAEPMTVTTPEPATCGDTDCNKMVGRKNVTLPSNVPLEFATETVTGQLIFATGASSL